MRAVAVLLVVCGHLFAWPAGGFIGVDVFFVISGFLITQLLLREYERTGRISLGSFYAHRARRLLPNAALVLVAVLVAAWAFLPLLRARQAAVDVVWAQLFAANINFERQQADYFQRELPPSPVQHFWSLSVEEQFYFVWPVLLLAVCLTLTRRRARAGALAKVLAVIVAALLGWAFLAAGDVEPGRYFSALCRGWELGAGAVLAAAAPACRRLTGRGRHVLLVLGLAGIAAAAVWTPPEVAGPRAVAVPVLATLCVLASGTAGAPPLPRLLGNRGMVYIGGASYALYLWHWPVIVILAAQLGEGSAAHLTWCLVLIPLLALSSYHLVEQPLRVSANRRSDGHRRGRTGPRQVSTARARAATAGLVVASLLGSFLVVRGSDASIAALESRAQRADPAAARSDGKEREVPAAGAGEMSARARTSAVRRALAARSWPDLNPPAELVGAQRPPEQKQGCQRTAVADPTACSFGPRGTPRSRTAVVVGDSVAIAWLPGIRRALQPAGWRVRGLTLEGCPQTDITLRWMAGEGPDGYCTGHRRQALAEVRRMRPGLVILSDSAANLTRLAPASRPWPDAAHRTYRALRAAAGRVVVLAPPPQGIDPQECATRTDDPGDCVSDITSAAREVAAISRRTARATGAEYAETLPWFCAAGRCPMFVGTTLVRRDYLHLTPTYSRQLAPDLRRVLLPPEHAGNS
nr:acyltransferase family protein [Streptomyces coryli]